MNTLLSNLQPADGTNVPLDPTSQIAVTLLSDLPGNILKPHGRDFVRLFFVEHEDPASAKAWVKTVGPKITTAFEQAEQTEKFKTGNGPVAVFVGLYLTPAGLKLVGVKDASIPDDAAFWRDMIAVAVLCGDGTKNDPQMNWESAYRDRKPGITSMLLLAFDETERSAADTLERDWITTPATSQPIRLKVAAREIGQRLANAAGQDIEPFGFADGIAKMTFLAKSPPDLPQKAWPEAFPLKHVLVPMGRRDDVDTFGSFLVFRKLEQDVEKFQNELATLATALSGNDTPQSLEEAGAFVVGRFRDGTPLTLQANPGRGPVDDFNYAATHGQVSDNGQRCPFHAHIRKMNPRADHDTNSALPPVDNSATPTPRGRLPVRRSIPYPPITAVLGQPASNPGLLFMAFMSNIEEKFEHLMKHWANDGAFPYPSSNLDPLIGRQPDRDRVSVLLPDSGNGSRTRHLFSACVTAKGGAYMLAPPRSFFTAL